MTDRHVSLSSILTALAWLPVVPLIGLSWWLSEPAVAALAVCCALAGATLVVLHDGHRTRRLVRVVGGLASPPDQSADLRSLR